MNLIFFCSFHSNCIVSSRTELHSMKSDSRKVASPLVSCVYIVNVVVCVHVCVT